MGLFDAIFGSDEQTVTQQLPAFLEAALQDNIDTANFLTDPFLQTQPTAAVAGFSPDQLAAFDALRPVVDQQLGKIYGGGMALDLARDFQAPQVGYANSYDNLSPYVNQYDAMVRDDVLNELDSRYADDMARMDRQAAAASPFGGSRSGLMSSRVSENYQRDRARQANLLSQQSFDKAMQYSSQDKARDLQAQLANQNAAFKQANTQLNAINTGGQAQTRRLNDNLSALQALMSSGGQQQGLFQQSLDTPFNMLNFNAGIASGTPYGATTTTSGGGGGLLGGLSGLGTAASGIADFAGIF